MSPTATAVPLQVVVTECCCAEPKQELELHSPSLNGS